MNGKLTYPNSLTSDKEGHVPTLTEEEEAKIKALHDVETIGILRTCMEDAQFLTDNKEACLKIALALFDKRCEKIETCIRRMLNRKLVDSG